MTDEGFPIRGGDSRVPGPSARERWSERTARFLESIPADSDNPVEAHLLCRNAGWSVQESKGAAGALVTTLSLFGSIEIIEDSSGATVIRNVSRYSLYLNFSLAAHLREGASLLNDWQRSPNPDGPSLEKGTLRGPDFLYLIERRRLQEAPETAVALRSTEICQAIIKARAFGSGHAGNYLVQFDAQANQYQLIGGHRRRDDDDLTMSMRRELAEELSRNQFVFDREGATDELTELFRFHSVEISRTTGASSDYAVHMYLLTSSKAQLLLNPGDRWVTERELLRGSTSDGKTIANDFVLKLNKDYGRGIRELPWSVNMRQPRRLVEVYQARRWETWGLVVGVVGIVLAVLFYVFS